MIIQMNALYTSSVARFLAHFSRRCTIVLSTGKRLNFEKGKHGGLCTYEGNITKMEQEEYENAMMFMGI